MHRTKVKYENKQRAIIKKKKANKSYGSCALPSPLKRSIHRQNFIIIASIVLEICSGLQTRRNQGLFGKGLKVLDIVVKSDYL